MYYEAFKNIDRDRLDLIDIGQDLPRPARLTFRFMMLMLGEAWLGDSGNQYLYIGDDRSTVIDVMQELAKILDAENFDVEVDRTRARITVSGANRCRFYFIDPGSIDVMSRGIRYADVFIDLTMGTQHLHGEALNHINYLTYNLQGHHGAT